MPSKVGFEPTFDENVQYRLGILAEINACRTRPALYAYKLLARAKRFKGKNYYHSKSAKPVATHEGVRPVKEAARKLRRMDPLPPICRMPAGLCKAAMDHVRDIGETGKFDHKGSDGSTCPDRIKRYGTLAGGGENLSFGQHSAEHVVCGMLIDDGIPDRRYRLTLLEDTFDCIGIAHGPHKKAQKMCCIIFARDYLPGLTKGFLRLRKHAPAKGFTNTLCELRVEHKWHEENPGIFGDAAIDHLELKYDKHHPPLFLSDCELRVPSLDPVAKGQGFDLTVKETGKTMTLVEDPNMLASLVVKLSVTDAVMARVNTPPVIAKITLPRSMGKLMGQTHGEMKLLEANKDLTTEAEEAAEQAAMLHSEAELSVAAHKALTAAAEARDRAALAKLSELDATLKQAQREAEAELTELRMKVSASDSGNLDEIFKMQRELTAELHSATDEREAAIEAAIKESAERTAALEAKIASEEAAHTAALAALKTELGAAVAGAAAETALELELKAANAKLVAAADAAKADLRACEQRLAAAEAHAGGGDPAEMARLQAELEAAKQKAIAAEQEMITALNASGDAAAMTFAKQLAATKQMVADAEAATAAARADTMAAEAAKIEALRAAEMEKLAALQQGGVASAQDLKEQLEKSKELIAKAEAAAALAEAEKIALLNASGDERLEAVAHQLSRAQSMAHRAQEELADAKALAAEAEADWKALSTMSDGELAASLAAVARADAALALAEAEKLAAQRAGSNATSAKALADQLAASKEAAALAAAAALSELRAEFATELAEARAATGFDVELHARITSELAEARAAGAASAAAAARLAARGNDSEQMKALQAQIAGLHDEFAEAMKGKSRERAPLPILPALVPTQLQYRASADSYSVLHSPAAPIFAPQYPFAPNLSVDPDVLLREQQRVHGTQIGMVERLLEETAEHERQQQQQQQPQQQQQQHWRRNLGSRDHQQPQWQVDNPVHRGRFSSEVDYESYPRGTPSPRAEYGLPHDAVPRLTRHYTGNASGRTRKRGDAASAHAQVSRVANFSEGLLGSEFHRSLEGLQSTLVEAKRRVDGDVPRRGGLGSAAQKLSSRRQFF
jgi:hypothetical protein